MSIRKELTIAAGDAGDESTYVFDLGRRFAIIQVGCDDTDGIDLATTMSALASMFGADSLADVWLEDGSAIWVSGTLPAGSGGTFRFWLRGAAGARWVQVVLSNAIETDKPTTIFVEGHGPLN